MMGLPFTFAINIKKLIKTMITLANNTSIPQLGVGTWTLMGEVATQNVC